MLGSAGAAGGPGGTGYQGASGGNGASGGILSAGGGGGGGGAGSGQGGGGGNGTGGSGGSAGGGSDGGPFGGGGGGGAGGAHFSVAPSLANSANVTGGNGFAGGRGGAGLTLTMGGGGGGGAGGYGIVVTNSGVANNSGNIQGGAGGSGGSGGMGGNGGDGGVGVQFASAGVVFTNTGSVYGGHGGPGGDSLVGIASMGVGGTGIVGSGLSVINSGTVAGGMPGPGVLQANAITFTGGNNSLTLQAGSNIQGNVVVAAGGGTLALGGGTNSTFNAALIGSQYQGFGAFAKTGSSTWALTGSTTAATPWTLNQGTLQVAQDGSLGAVSGGLTFNGGALQLTGSFGTARAMTLAAGGGTLDTNANTLSISGAISGPGSLTQTGAGTLILTGANSYTGGTTVSGGTLQGNSTSLQGNIVNNGSVVFDQTGTGTYAGAMSGIGAMTLQGGGSLTMSGANTYTGYTVVDFGSLIVKGNLAGPVLVNYGGSLNGNGIVGGVTLNGGILGPGTSIGTLTITNGLVLNGGTHQVEIDSTGVGDRVNVGGTALINGGTVQVQAAPGSYANSTTYTIVNAAGGLSGSYAGVSDNLAFLTPTLSYDANNAYLTLALQGNAFSGGALTNNQRATGSALDRSYATASGDFATVIGALAGLSTGQGPVALDAISGQQYANFGTTNVANAALFMNALGQQMANARSGSLPGSRVALAQACEVETCDDIRPLSAWIGGLGGLGSVQGNANSSTLTYNMGGTAVGVDYRFDPRFLVGLGVGYTHGTQWTNGFPGQGWSDALSLAAYGSFTQGSFYADALAGYAYLSNQMQRQIQVPNLQPRTASGSTGANQFLTQLETGYKLGLWDQAMTLTPFGRLQFSTTTQNAFTESGAQSLSLNVAQQTTNSLRTVLGADFAGSIPLANQRRLDLALRLGWQHEFANTARPITAAFAGAPGAAFTVYGAAPKRDAAIVGLSAATTVADATQLYVRYDGMLGSGTDNHALTAGFRLSW